MRINSNLVMRDGYLREQGFFPEEVSHFLKIRGIRQKKLLENRYRHHLFLTNVEVPETYAFLSPAE